MENKIRGDANTTLNAKTMNRTKSKQEKFNTMLYDYFITNTFQNRRTSEKFRTTLSNSDYRLNEERIVVYRKGKILDKCKLIIVKQYSFWQGILSCWILIW